MSVASRTIRPLSRNSRAILQISTTSSHPQHIKDYHSYDHPAPPTYGETESKILSAALTRVPEYGFTERSLSLGAQDAGYLTITTNLLPRGVFELVMFHLVRRREALKNAVEREAFITGEGRSLKSVWEEGKVGVGGRVRSLILERLKANEESGIVERWQQALAIMAQPSYIPPSTTELWRLADEIWFLAGDTSVDTSWYTKRASLSAIFAATEVFQTQDQSAEYKDTERFLDARLDELRRFGTTASALREWAGYTGMSVYNVLRSKGMRI